MDEGEVLAGRYRLIARVGTGAMDVVWKAHDERLDRIVAVKQLLHAGTSEVENEEAQRRALREGRITARLHHPHAITVYNVAEHDGTPYLIMEYLPSESLSAVLAERGPLPPAEVARIGSQIAAALAAAHEAGIVHRDIKPSNVLLADNGTAKITDFVISCAVGDGSGTATGILAGTSAYLAPEVARGQEAGFPADVFSLGCTLYAAVEGVPPFGLDDNALALLFRIGNSEITPPKQSGPLAPVLARLLDRDLSRRPTMRQAQEALASAATTLAVPTPSSAPETAGALPFPAPGPSATAAPPPKIGARPAMAALAGDAPALWPPTEDVKQSPSSPAAMIFVVASLLVAGVMVVATLSYNGSNTAGSEASPPSTMSGTAESQQALQLVPPAASTTGTAPIIAPILAAVLAPSSAPSPPPRSKPSPAPGPTSHPAPTPGPTPSPTPGPMPTPTPSPTSTLTPSSTPSPTSTPTSTPTPGPTPSPTPDPTPSPTSTPTPSLTASP